MRRAAQPPSERGAELLKPFLEFLNFTVENLKITCSYFEDYRPANRVDQNREVN